VQGEGGSEFANVLLEGEESSGEAFQATIKSQAGTVKTQTPDQQ
jgi:hypothetical protein